MVTVNQKSLRANLEEMRLKQTRLLLSYQGEGLEKKLTEDMDSAQEAIERAREVTEMEARRQRQREEEEEREREKLKREEEERKRWVICIGFIQMRSSFIGFFAPLYNMRVLRFPEICTTSCFTPQKSGIILAGLCCMLKVSGPLSALY